MRFGVCSGLVFVMLSGVGCGGPTDSDAGIDQVMVCANAADCSDGLFCNGEETCGGVGATGADARGCVPATTPCMASQACSEADDECETQCGTMPDADGDGHDAVVCDGDDCADNDMNRFPGNAEVCDDGHDEDCDPDTLGTTDGDTDGRISDACCNDEVCGDDCDDALPAVFTGASEMCNAADDDCDGTSDEGLSVGSYYRDCDGDGTGDQNSPAVPGCGSPGSAPTCATSLSGAGWALANGDCNDGNPDVAPGTTEICNGMDDNCNGSTDEGVVPTCYQNLDGDAYGNSLVMLSSCTCPSGYVTQAGDCNDTPGVGANIYPGANEQCDGFDNNCNNLLDFPGEDDDGDGYADASQCMGVPNATDCNDTPGAGANINPGRTEITANGIDDNCNGQEICYVNADGDAYGTSATVATTDIGCVAGMQHSLQPGDCCDTDNRAFPGQTMYFTSARTTCGGYDFNCVNGDERAPVTNPTTISTGACAGSVAASCSGSTLTPGWVGAAPTACGQVATYNNSGPSPCITASR